MCKLFFEETDLHRRANTLYEKPECQDNATFYRVKKI